MRRALTGELNDIFAEVGLGHFDPGSLQGGIEMYLFGGHRLGFDGMPAIRVLRNIVDNLPRLGRRRRPVHDAASPLYR